MFDFIYDQLEKHNPDVFLVTRDLEILETSRKASWDKAENGINEMKAQLNIVQKIAPSIPIIEGDKFKEVQDTIATCAKEFSETCLVWDDVQNLWKTVSAMYCKDPSKGKPEAFFNQVYNFVKQFQIMKENIEKKQKEDEENEKKNSLKQSQKAELDKKKSELANRKALLEERKKAKETVLEETITLTLDLGSKPLSGSDTPSSPRSMSTLRTLRAQEGVSSPRRSKIDQDTK